MEKIKIKKPYIGAAYYPEDWPLSEIPKDIALMKKAGIKCVRMAEFAWKRMEPQEGKYDFTWLHTAVDALYDAGIAVILCSPSATPPYWLTKKYPDIHKKMPGEWQTSHGGRRDCCSCNENYINACLKIISKLGEEFGQDKAVIAWQLDNEIYSLFSQDCICDNCKSNFHRHLKEKYGTAEEINEKWNLNIFSQAYDDIDEIPAPVYASHNPHIQFEWQEAHAKADIDFIARQAAELRKYTSAPISTDMIPFAGMDLDKMCKNLDLAMINHYNTPENLKDCTFWFDYMRNIKKGVPFINTETATNWNGATFICQPIKHDGFCRVNSFLPVLLGGEGNMYWLWRQHWGGHEYLHGSCITAQGKPCNVFSEIENISADFEKASDFFENTRIKSDTAIIISHKSSNMFQSAPAFQGHNYSEDLLACHRALCKIGIRPDVIGVFSDFSDYKVIVAPSVLTFEDEEIGERLLSFVRSGGTLIAGPLTDVRTPSGALYKERVTKYLETACGVTRDYDFIPDENVVKAQWSDKRYVKIDKFCECFTYKEKENILISLSEAPGGLEGRGICGKFSFGKGNIILIGSYLQKDDLAEIYNIACRGLKKYDASENIVFSFREGKEKSGAVLCECDHKKGRAFIPFKGTDILSGREIEGETEIAPYEIMVIEKR